MDGGGAMERLALEFEARGVTFEWGREGEERKRPSSSSMGVADLPLMREDFESGG